MSKLPMPNSVPIKFAFLDRDGVIFRKPAEGVYLRDWQEADILPGAEQGIKRLNELGITVLLVTNQRGIALGKMTMQDLAMLHARLQQYLGAAGAHLDRIYFCPHDEGQCTCRKPATGMIDQAFADFPSASPQASVFIGDSLSDIQAGRAAGMRTILIKGDPERQKPDIRLAHELADRTVRSLPEAVQLISTWQPS